MHNEICNSMQYMWHCNVWMSCVSFYKQVSSDDRIGLSESSLLQFCKGQIEEEVC